MPLSMSTMGPLPPDAAGVPPAPTLIPPLPVPPRVLEPGAELAEQAMAAAIAVALMQSAIFDQDNEAKDIHNLVVASRHTPAAVRFGLGPRPNNRTAARCCVRFRSNWRERRGRGPVDKLGSGLRRVMRAREDFDHTAGLARPPFQAESDV